MKKIGDRRDGAKLKTNGFSKIWYCNKSGYFVRQV